MILITGATGNLGYLTLIELLKQKTASEIAVLVRKENEKTKELSALGVDIRFGDYGDLDSLKKAFRHINTLFFVSTLEAGKDFTLHNNVVQAAITCGINRIVYTSTQGGKSEGMAACSAGDLHGWTENEVKNSGLNYTILRNSPYMESLPYILGDKVTEVGFSMPAGDGKLSLASRADMAIASAKILSTDGHNNRTYEFGGVKSVGYKEIMKYLSKISGKELLYYSPDAELYEKQCQEAGIPDQAITATLSFASQMKFGYFDHPTQDLASILGREPISVETYLKETYN